MVEKCQISWLIVPAGRTRRHLLLSRQTDIKLIMLLFWSYLCPEAASAKTASFYWILWETFLKIITLFKHFIALFIIFKLFAFHCLLSRWTKYDFFLILSRSRETSSVLFSEKLKKNLNYMIWISNFGRWGPHEPLFDSKICPISDASKLASCAAKLFSN